MIKLINSHLDRHEVALRHIRDVADLISRAGEVCTGALRANKKILIFLLLLTGSWPGKRSEPFKRIMVCLFAVLRLMQIQEKKTNGSIKKHSRFLNGSR